MGKMWNPWKSPIGVQCAEGRSVRSLQAADDKSTQLYLTRRIAYPIRQQASTLSGLPRKFGDSRHAVRRRAGSFAVAR